MRYNLNILFKQINYQTPKDSILESFKTLKEAMEWSEMIDETVERALIKDKVTGKIIWLKGGPEE